MRFHATLATGLAALLVAPRLVPGTDELATLEEALVRTVRALEVLGGVQERIERDPAAGPGWARAVTEAPVGDERARDRRLEALRHEVNLLQMELDAIEAPTASLLELPTDITLVPVEGTDGPGTPLAGEVAVGLDEETRALLEGLVSGEPTPNTARHMDGADGAGADPSADAPGRPPEFEGYSADLLGQAEACFRAGLFERGLKLVAGIADDPRALAVKGRCLERLDRLDESVATFEALLELLGEGPDAERARADLDFVRWKRDFLRRIESTEEGR